MYTLRGRWFFPSVRRASPRTSLSYVQAREDINMKHPMRDSENPKSSDDFLSQKSVLIYGCYFMALAYSQMRMRIPVLYNSRRNPMHLNISKAVLLSHTSQEVSFRRYWCYCYYHDSSLSLELMIRNYHSRISCNLITWSENLVEIINQDYHSSLLLEPITWDNHFRLSIMIITQAYHLIQSLELITR